MTTTTIPAPAADVLVYVHPQGKTIHVHPDGSMAVYKPDGKRSSSSATPEKLAAGYGGWTKISGGTTPPATAPELVAGETLSTVYGTHSAMTFMEADLGNVDVLVEPEHVVVEQKLDGTRTLVVITESGVRFLSRNGGPLKHAAAAAHFGHLRPTFASLLGSGDRGTIVLDGEIITETGELWLFDCPNATSNGTEIVCPSKPLRHRRAALVAFGRVLTALNDRVRVVPQATTLRSKTELLRAVESCGGEGVMIKHRDSPYNAGARVAHSMKVKFVKTADVVVLDRDTGGRKNAELAVYVGSALLRVGNCSMIGKPDVQPGDVIEVAYLYWTGEKLYQPRMMKIRDDKTAADCTLGQLPAYSRKVIEL
jgi:ATP-dependent DNA ligase